MTKKNSRAEALAARIEQGAAELAAFAEELSEPSGESPATTGTAARSESWCITWDDVSDRGGRREDDRDRQALDDVTWEVVAGINAKHSAEHGGVTRAEALELLRGNSRAAAEAIRAFTDEQLDSAAPFSLSFGAPMTAQFVIEDHALRHPGTISQRCARPWAGDRRRSVRSVPSERRRRPGGPTPLPDLADPPRVPDVGERVRAQAHEVRALSGLERAAVARRCRAIARPSASRRGSPRAATSPAFT